MNLCLPLQHLLHVSRMDDSSNSGIDPPYSFEIKLTAPDGVIPTRPWPYCDFYNLKISPAENLDHLAAE